MTFTIDRLSTAVTTLLCGAFEDGQTFLAGVLARIPESLRSQVKEALDKPEAKDAVTLLGDGVLARADYSKHMDAVRKQDEELKAKLAETTTLYEQNVEWKRTHQKAIDEAAALKAENDRLRKGVRPDADPDEPLPALDKVALQALVDEQLEKTLATREVGYVEVVAFMNDLGFKHQQLFGEPVNMQALIRHPKVGKPVAGQPGRVFSLQDAYNETYGEAVAAKAKAAHDKDIETEVQKRLGEERAKLIGQPFPIRDAQPAAIDVLLQETPPKHDLDSAVALYDQLQAGKGL